MPATKFTPAVVLTSQTSHPIGLAIIRALGQMGVPITLAHYEGSEWGLVSRFAVDRIRIPHPERDERDFINVLIGRAPSRRRPVLIAGDDATLSVVSRHKRTLDSYYVVACNGEDITRTVIDKKRTYALARSIGIPAPRTFVPASIRDVERYGAAMVPCVVKPCLSHQYFESFREKMVKVDSTERLIAEYRKAADSGHEVMMQEFIPGDDSACVNYNSLFWNDEPLAEFTAEKVRLAPPPFGVPRVVVSKEVPEIVEPGRRLLRAMGFRGFSCIEFKRDARDGKYKLMEVNGRHNRSGLLALRCGVNFPWLEYRCFLGDAPARQSSVSSRRVSWIDEFNDISYSFLLRKEERYALSAYAAPYLGSHVFAIWDIRDPKPFLKRCIDAVRIACGIQRRHTPALAPPASVTVSLPASEGHVARSSPQ